MPFVLPTYRDDKTQLRSTSTRISAVHSADKRANLDPFTAHNAVRTRISERRKSINSFSVSHFLCLVGRRANNWINIHQAVYRESTQNVEKRKRVLRKSSKLCKLQVRLKQSERISTISHHLITQFLPISTERETLFSSFISSTNRTQLTIAHWFGNLIKVSRRWERKTVGFAINNRFSKSERTWLQWWTSCGVRFGGINAGANDASKQSALQRLRPPLKIAQIESFLFSPHATRSVPRLPWKPVINNRATRRQAWNSSFLTLSFTSH